MVPSETENKVQMRSIVSMFATGDLRTVAKAIDTDYVDHQGLDSVETRGLEGFSRVVTAARSAVPNLQITIEDLIAEDNKVVARLRWFGTTLSGAKIERETIDIVRFTDGRAVEHWGTCVSMSQDLRDPEPTGQAP